MVCKNFEEFEKKVENFKKELDNLLEKYELDLYAGYISAGDSDDNIIVCDRDNIDFVKYIDDDM